MKKLLLFTIITLFSFATCKADQLQIITKEQAIKAVELIKKQQKIVNWCSCCEAESVGSEFIVIAVRNVYLKINDLTSTEESNYIVVVQGINLNDNTVYSEEIDLAYLHIGINNNSLTVAEALNIPFRKCNDALIWDEAIITQYEFKP